MPILKRMQQLRGLLFAAAAAALLMASGSLLASAHAQTPRDAVLAVNAEFYRAFRESDITAMDRVWGKVEPIAVQHPSGPKLQGRALVMASWAQILLRPPNITCTVVDLRLTEARATVDCIEHLDPGTVRMQNIFHRENGAWKMIYHGPIPDRLSSSPASVLVGGAVLAGKAQLSSRVELAVQIDIGIGNDIAA